MRRSSGNPSPSWSTLDVPLAKFHAVANPRRHHPAGIAKLRFLRELGRRLRLNVLEEILALVAHRSELIDRRHALMADEARFPKRPRIAVEPHLFRRHAGDLDRSAWRPRRRSRLGRRSAAAASAAAPRAAEGTTRRRPARRRPAHARRSSTWRPHRRRRTRRRSAGGRRRRTHAGNPGLRRRLHLRRRRRRRHRLADLNQLRARILRQNLLDLLRRDVGERLAPDTPCGCHSTISGTQCEPSARP